VIAAESGADVHHGAPRCLLRLFDAVARDLAEWSEFDAEAEHLSIKVRGLSREDMTVLIALTGGALLWTLKRRLGRR
jgi:hypothetical protein